MEIFGMSLEEALNFLLRGNTSKEGRVIRMKIKAEISKKIAGRRNGDAILVAKEAIKILYNIKNNLNEYPELGIADILSLIDSRSSILDRHFPPDIQSKIKEVICWPEWKKFPLSSPVRSYR
ncbi:MAG: hypothetical protein EOM84_02920 [Sphingobacteriia bacterium]|jgi:hypothetical protein|nr:hypothetical protein [Sphingobacteriia bacterium]